MSDLKEYKKFFHFRYSEPSGKLGLENLPELQFVPIREPYSNGGVTVVVRENNGTLYFGAAKCSLIDTYSKKYGRIRSEGISRSSTALVTDLLHKDDITALAVNIAKNINSGIGIEASLKDAKKFLPVEEAVV